ncbi:MAG: acyl-CoA thioesterase [Muribaculaceae bacterium]|nr:acyl-CoA thioesterase [Muribaculaceae bacterium]
MNKYQFTLEIAVRDYELDAEGIVNNANYLHYMEHTRHAFCRRQGYSFAQMTADGIVPVARRVEIDYLAPLHSGDVMLSCLNVVRKGPRYIFMQDIFNQATGQLAVKAQITIVAIENGKISRGDRLARLLPV